MSNSFPLHRAGILFLISAPSGAGKTTLCQALRQKQEFAYAVSCTTRPPRPGEIHGEDYHFISPESFEARVQAGDFLEYAQVHLHRYGTLLAPILSHIEAGRDVLLDIDTAGAESIRACSHIGIREALVDIFLLPPSIEELQRRLEKRGTESAQEIATRVRNAAAEISHWPRYRYTIVSRSIEENLATFRAIVQAEHCRTRRLQSGLQSGLKAEKEDFPPQKLPPVA